MRGDGEGDPTRQLQALLQAGSLGEALALCRDLCRRQPDDAGLQAQAGMLAARLGDLEEAVTFLSRALVLAPQDPRMHANLAVVRCQRGELGEAAALLEQAVRLAPGRARSFHDLALVRQQQGRLEEAISAYRKAIALQPDYVEALDGLGVALCRTGQLEAAVDCFRSAIRYRPRAAGLYNNLGMALRELGEHEAAADSFRQALRLQPGHAEAHNNLGVTCAQQGLLGEAEQHFRRTLAIDPGHLSACANLANVLQDLGRWDEGEALYRRVLQQDPHNAAVHSRLLMGLNYHTRYRLDEVFQAHVEWGRRHGCHVGESPPSVRAVAGRHPERPLRIAYVSPDFRNHSVAAFIAPVLAAHDRRRVEVFCYAAVRHPDETTRRLEALADHWRNVCALDDERLAALIRDDRIDILVDLAGHTAGSRLAVFARRPAPVQVSWLGYPNTTGLASIQYRITDAIADPPEETEVFYTEKLVRLPHGFLCYQGDEAIPPRDAAGEGPVTFGSFNNLAKITPAVIALWAEILKQVPDARLLLKTRPLRDEAVARHLAAAFAAYGIPAARLELRGWLAGREDHLVLYRKVDIALDTFPYNGTTTTCEALWMGVPVITLAGRTHAGRVGASLLSRLGLEEYIAANEAAYVEQAVSLAGDRMRRTALHTSLRERMKTSPLCNARLIAGDLEDAYETMWRACMRARDG